MKFLALLFIAWSSVAAASVPETVPVKMPEATTHPRVILSTGDLAGVRERAATLPWASAIARSVLEKADSLAAEPLDIPHSEGQWTHWYTCPDDGTTLKAESPTTHVCSTCGKTYSGPPYDAVYVTKRHSHWLQGIEDLGYAYALEPKPAYAKRVRDILVEYASFYGDLELHDIYGKKGTAKDRLFGQTLNSAVALCSMSLGYDIVFDAPVFSSEDHAIIESKFLRPMVADIRANPRGISNWQTWHNAAVCGTGLLLGDREYVDWSINGPNGLLYQLNRGSVMPSGMWYEESPSYHWYALDAMVFQLESCRRSGMSFYGYPIVKGLFAAPVRQLLPDGTFIPLHDSARESIADRRQFYEIAYREYGDPLYAALSQPRRDNWALFLGATEMPGNQAPPAMASSNDTAEGLAVMRTAGETVAMMDYGPGVSAHVQPAKLNLVLYALGDIRFVDPGRLPYGNPMHAKWYRQSIAHNTVVVDEKSHAKAPGKLTSWVAEGDMSLVRATCEKAYPGVTLDRTLLLKGGVLLDVFVCAADKDSTFDMPLHLKGELEGLGSGETATPFGSKDGYGVLMDVRSLPEGRLRFRATATDRGSIDVQTFDESENYRAIGYGTCSMQEKLPAVIRRQRGKQAVFAAAYQILKPGESPVAVKWDASARELTAGDLRLQVGDHETKYATEPGGALRTAPREVAAAGERRSDEAAKQVTAIRIDFGSEDVAEGYVEANAGSVYSATVGHGWLGTPSLHDDIQDKPEALDSDFDRHRDFTWSYAPAEFRIDVPPATYELAVTSGDFNIGGPATLVSVSGCDVTFPSLKPSACEFLTARAAFVLKQSPLILRFSSEEGNNWQLNDLVLKPVDSLAPAVVESNVVKFFEKARVAGQQQAATPKVRVIASNYPKLDSLTLEGPSPIAELWDSYVEDLKVRETFERGATTREDYRSFQASLKARQYPSVPEGAPSLPTFGLIDSGVLDHFTPWGIYVGEDGSSRFDLLSRVSLTRRLAEGQLNDHSTELADCLRSGAYTSLFLRTAADADPVCHAARVALFEMNAMFAAAKAEKNEIGMFKRAAHLALAATEPDRIKSAEEADLVSQLLGTAYDYAAFTEDFPEQPAPEDVSYLVVLKPLAFTLPSAPKSRPAVPDYLEPAIMKAQMRKVYDFALAHPRLAQHHGWEKAAFHVGIIRAYLATKDPEYLAESVRWSERAGYDVFMDRRGASNADNLACAQVYLDLYLLQGGDEKLESIRSIADKFAANPPKGREAWWWCDSLFMAPPVFAKLARATGDPKYATLMNSLWWDSKDYLFNKEEQLFFRDKRYFEAKTESGKPVIWGRGNGWVLSGLALILTDLPKDDPRYGDYLAVYREMAARIASIQGVDGMWRTSLADPAEFPMPESSCTAFFTHALAWGVNNGVLDRGEYEPVVRRAWRALNQVVYPTGKIGWVQHVAGAPGMVAPDMTREYAPGAFLLAGSEVLTLVESKP